jgi:hypothetical protein
MENNFKVPYGIDSNNNIVKIAKANPKQIYYCNCGSELIVKNGNIYLKHFAHKNSENCTPESWIHKEFKNTLFKNKKLLYYDNVLNKDVLLEFDEVILEKNINDFRPDAIGIIGNKEYIIEFRYTHKVDVKKTNKIKLSNLFAIEIYTYFFDYETDNVSFLLENTIRNKKVINDPFIDVNKVIEKHKENFNKHLQNISNKKIAEIKSLENQILFLEKRIKQEKLKNLKYKRFDNILYELHKHRTIMLKYVTEHPDGNHIFDNENLKLQLLVNQEYSLLKINSLF